MRSCHPFHGTKTRCLHLLLVTALWSGLQARVLAATEAPHWNTGNPNATWLYGEITVLATLPGMYYCGAQFDQGYPGIQHLGRETMPPGLNPTTGFEPPRAAL